MKHGPSGFALYPKVPVGYPDGAQDEESTYLHLIDRHLEIQADRQLIGRERTARAMQFWSEHHYRWVYIDDHRVRSPLVRQLVPSWQQFDC